jgi:hypothetical protein
MLCRITVSQQDLVLLVSPVHISGIVLVHRMIISDHYIYPILLYKMRAAHLSFRS